MSRMLCVRVKMILHGVKKCLTFAVMGIWWHIGFSETKENHGTLGQAMDKYPVILALHEADMEAFKILEAES